MNDLDPARLVERLASIPDRGSATPGEAAAAAFIASELRSRGLDPRLEHERVHGTHWWPYGLPTAIAAIAGAAALRRPGRLTRAVAIAVGLAASASIVEDVQGSRRLVRRTLPQRTTTNVLAELGPPDAAATVVVHAHHDAARAGLMFHPALARTDGPIPTMAEVAGAPALVGMAAARGSRGLLAVASAATLLSAALFVDCGARRTVPGANDDASGVAGLLELAGRLAADPPGDLRVIFLSTGSEESMLEGMSAFARRHFPSLPKASTVFMSLDSLGWDTLALRGGDGVFRQHPAPPELVELMRDCASELGIPLREGLRLWVPTDGFVAARAGYRTINVCSVHHDGTYPGYHTPQDVAERVHQPTIRHGADLCEAAIRRLAEASV